MKRKLIFEVETATKFRNRFLKAIDEKKCFLITKDFRARVILIPVSEFEDIYSDKKVSLILLGAKKCNEKTAKKTITEINKAKFFSKVVFVYGYLTKKYINFFNVPDLRIILNKKGYLPIITSLKLGITSLSEKDQFAIFSFLSKPVSSKVFYKIAKKISSVKEGIVIPLKNQKPTHPVAISKKFFRKIISLRKELGIPYLIRKFKKDIHYIAI